MSAFTPEPIIAGDRVEAGLGFGVVTEVTMTVRRHRTRHGVVEKPVAIYTVAIDKGGTVKTQNVSYCPTPEIVAAKAAEIRAGKPMRQDNDADFVGFAGPGIRCTNLVTGPKGWAP